MIPYGDFKKVNTTKYRTWRVLNAPGAWAEVYRERAAKFRGIPGAIIFPEQVLALRQEAIFSVGCTKVSDCVSGQISVVRNFVPRGLDEELDSFEKILEFEAAHALSGTTHRMILGKSQSNNSFYTQALFTSKSSALKYVMAEMEARLSVLA